MNETGPYLKPLSDTQSQPAGFLHWCPACCCGHFYEVPRWTFNGNFEKPTFMPSMLITIPSDENYRCHYFVTDGEIQFCADSKHEYAGKTIPMIDLDADLGRLREII